MREPVFSMLFCRSPWVELYLFKLNPCAVCTTHISFYFRKSSLHLFNAQFQSSLHSHLSVHEVCTVLSVEVGVAREILLLPNLKHTRRRTETHPPSNTITKPSQAQRFVTASSNTNAIQESPRKAVNDVHKVMSNLTEPSRQSGYRREEGP